MKKSLFKSAAVKNAGWIIGGKITQMGISLIVGLLTARYLGPSNYGLINYVSAYTAFFMSFCTLGINSVLVKEFIDHPEEEGTFLGTSLAMRAASSFLSAGVIVCAVSIIDRDEPTTIAIAALSSLGLLFQILDTFQYWFQSKLKSKVTAIASLSAYTITAAYKIVLLSLGKSVEWFAFATSLDYICMGIMLLWAYYRCGGQKLAFSSEVGRQILSKSKHFILPGLMVSVYGQADKWMLKQMLGETEVGYYATAVTVCGMWCFVLSAIIDSAYPSIMSAHQTDRNLFEKRNRQLYAAVFYISVMVSAVICIFGNSIIKILYGEQYISAAAPLRIVTWYTAFSYLGVARNAWIVCEGCQKYLKYIYITAALSNVVLNLVFIPHWGAMGAAAASLVTQILTTIVVPFCIKPLKRNSVLMIEGILLKYRN